MVKEDNFLKKPIFFWAFFFQNNMNKVKFNPQLSPKEMLKLGVFGGYYFEGIHSEYPKDWFKDAKLSNDGYNINLNCHIKQRTGLRSD